MNKTSLLMKKTLKYSATAALALHLFPLAGIAGANQTQTEEVRSVASEATTNDVTSKSTEKPTAETLVIHHPEMSALIAPNDPAYFGVTETGEKISTAVEDTTASTVPTSTVKAQVATDSEEDQTEPATDSTKGATRTVDSYVGEQRSVPGLSSSSVVGNTAAEAGDVAATTAAVAAPSAAESTPSTLATDVQAAANDAQTAAAVVVSNDEAIVQAAPADSAPAEVATAPAGNTDTEVSNVAQIARASDEVTTSGSTSSWLLALVAALAGIGILAAAPVSRLLASK